LHHLGLLRSFAPAKLVFPVAALALGACAGRARTTAVTPAEIPGLLQQAKAQPDNAAVRFRLAAGLAAAGRCDTAVVVAQAAQVLAPDDVTGPLVTGHCQEADSRFDLAFQTYRDFADAHPKARGVAVLRAKQQLALHASAVQNARAALAHEAELSSQPPQPSTLAVLPLTISGDSTYQPLSRGLAELVTTDLALVRSLRLVERLQVGALLDEMKLGASGKVDASTAARMGQMLRAERMVQGVASISKNAPVQLSASLVSGDGTVRRGSQVSGSFKSLLDLEKRLVFDVAAGLGIQLTEAERQRILAQGPKNLTSFLAYSDGITALDRGDYQAAQRAFSASLRADPSFGAAQQGLQTSQVAPSVAGGGAGELTTVVQTAEQVTEPTIDPVGGAISAAGQDVAPTLTDQLTQSTGGSTTDRQPTVDDRGIGSVTQASGIIRIIFRRPP
jgi:tetratricopeptide (TPR) repeat protein